MTLSHIERLWDAGQRQLSAGRYVTAQRQLESAEALAWRSRDAATLASLYLPLLEVRRQIRQNAVEGVLLVIADDGSPATRRALAAFLRQPAGTCLLRCRDARRAAPIAAAIQCSARRAGGLLETLLVVTHRCQTRLTSAPIQNSEFRIRNSTFAAGLDVRFTANPADTIDPAAVLAAATQPSGVETSPISPQAGAIPLPPPATYDPAVAAHQPLHALARESLLVAWEALALKWQSRNPLPAAPPSPAAAWTELAWLRLTLRIDPACEPAAMRLMSLAQSVACSVS